MNNSSSYRTFVSPERKLYTTLCQSVPEHISVSSETVILHGYQLYVNTDWLVKREHITKTCVVYTGDTSHSIVASIIKFIKTQSNIYPTIFGTIFSDFERDKFTPKDTPYGTIMIANLSNFPPSQNVLIPSGDYQEALDLLRLHINLKRLGCGERGTMSLKPPSQAVIDKFYQTYNIRPSTIPQQPTQLQSQASKPTAGNDPLTSLLSPSVPMGGYVASSSSTGSQISEKLAGGNTAAKGLAEGIESNRSTLISNSVALQLKSLQGTVQEIAHVVQTALFLFGLLPPEYVDGLLCDSTQLAMQKFYNDFGPFNIEIHANNWLEPALLVAVCSTVYSLRAKCTSLGYQFSKDPFLDTDGFMKQLRSFQKSQDLPTITGKLDVATIQRIETVFAKSIPSSAVHALKSKLEGFGSKLVGAGIQMGIHIPHSDHHHHNHHQHQNGATNQATIGADANKDGGSNSGGGMATNILKKIGHNMKEMGVSSMMGYNYKTALSLTNQQTGNPGISGPITQGTGQAITPESLLKGMEWGLDGMLAYIAFERARKESKRRGTLKAKASFTEAMRRKPLIKRRTSQGFLGIGIPAQDFAVDRQIPSPVIEIPPSRIVSASVPYEVSDQEILVGKVLKEKQVYGELELLEEKVAGSPGSQATTTQVSLPENVQVPSNLTSSDYQRGRSTDVSDAVEMKGHTRRAKSLEVFASENADASLSITTSKDTRKTLTPSDLSIVFRDGSRRRSRSGGDVGMLGAEVFHSSPSFRSDEVYDAPSGILDGWLEKRNRGERPSKVQRGIRKDFLEARSDFLEAFKSINLSLNAMNHNAELCLPASERGQKMEHIQNRFDAFLSAQKVLYKESAIQLNTMSELQRSQLTPRLEHLESSVVFKTSYSLQVLKEKIEDALESSKGLDVKLELLTKSAG